MHGCGRGFRVRFKGQIFTTEPPLLYIARAERPACTLYLPLGFAPSLSTFGQIFLASKIWEG